jgi:hypothetical protein
VLLEGTDLYLEQMAVEQHRYQMMKQDLVSAGMCLTE